MTRAYYAAGRRDGRPALLLAFDRKAARDLFVALDPARRAPVAATAPIVQAARRFEQRTGYSVIRANGEATQDA